MNFEMFFQNSKKLIHYSNNEFLIEYSIKNEKDLEKLNLIKNWEFNRPPNFEKINNIFATMQNGSYVDLPIFLFIIENKNNTEYVCYDGIHRLFAIKAYIEYLLKNKVLFLKNIIFNTICFKNKNNDEEYKKSIHEVILRRFKIINSAEPIAEIYKNFKDNELKVKVLKIIEYLSNKYSQFISSSSRPHIPNTNRYMLTNNIEELVKKNPSISIDEFIKIIEDLNNYYINNYYIKKYNFSFLNEKQLKKCLKYKCFLFAKKNYINEDVIQLMIFKKL